MTMRAAVPMMIAAAALAAAGCSETKTGLRVSIDPAEFTQAESMRVAISAEGGFKPQANENMGGALVTTEDFDGDGALGRKGTGTYPFLARADHDNADYGDDGAQDQRRKPRRHDCCKPKRDRCKQ